MTAVVQVRSVSKALGSSAVLSDVSFEVGAGTISALVGPNGAGKTTLMTLLAGLRRPDAGTVTVAGVDPRSRTARERLAVVQQELLFPPTLRADEILRYVAGARTWSGRGLRMREALAAFGLDDVARKQVGGLSGGQRRRLAVALAVTNAPDIVLLDEMTANLDSSGRATTWRLVDEYVAQGGTVVVSSHLLSDVDEHADAVVVLAQGRVVLCDAVAAVRAASAVATVSFRVTAGREAAVRAAVRAAVASAGAVDVADVWTVRTSSPEAVVSAAMGADPGLRELRVAEPSVTDSIDTLLRGRP